MDFTDISSMLVDLAASLEQNQTQEIESTIKRINEVLDKKEEDETKRKMIELVNKITGDEYRIYITQNDENKDLYDISLLLGIECRVWRCTTESVIASAVEHNGEGYIVEKISRENIKKFMTAIYIYDRIAKKNQIIGERKDLFDDTNSINYLHFSAVERTIPTYAHNPLIIYLEEIPFIAPSKEVLELGEYNNITTFEEALNIVYENKLVGSRLKLIK